MIVLVKKDGIAIPMEKLKGINEGDIVKVEITKIYVSKRIKKDLIRVLNLE
jgi:uncharacterized secreted protein with C-terminal beta-propeller domain